MFDNLEDITIVSIIQNTNKPYVKIENRKTYTFFFRTRGSVCYEFADQKIIGKQGNVVFMPKGSTYTVTALTESPAYTSINFECNFPGEAKPKCYSLERFYDSEFAQNILPDQWNFGNQAEKYQCISFFYSLLAHLSKIENATNFDNARFHIIEPAVIHLKKHLHDPELKIAKLHRLCGISSTYFRQIFHSRFGLSPQEYVTSKRMAHAKSILLSGDFDTIGEVAFSLGYSDSLYFSKVFKKAFGISPSEMIQE